MLRFFCIFWLLTGGSLCALTQPDDIHKIQEDKANLYRDYQQVLLELTSLDKELVSLEEKHNAKAEEIASKKKEISHKLLLLSRLGRTNPLRVLVDTAAFKDTFRGISLLRTLTSSLKLNYQTLQNELQEIHTLAQVIKSRKENRTLLLDQIRQQQSELSSLEGTKLEEYIQSELDRLANVDDVNTLLEETRHVLSKAKSKKSVAPLLGDKPIQWLEKPVAGKIIEDEALQKKFSPTGQGIIFETEKNADVFAAQAGKVVFRGPFKKKENITLIIDHGNKVYTVYMGMHKIDAELGQNVYTGERLGTMAGYGESSPKLYFELRQEGPVDPKSYFVD